MVVPDLEQICEIMLFSEGFDSARMLAKKMTVLYSLSKEQLSKQHHYDFGEPASCLLFVCCSYLNYFLHI